MTRRKLFASLPTLPAVLSLGRSCDSIAVHEEAEDVVLSNGLATVVCDKRSGRFSFSWNGAPLVRNAYASAIVEAGTLRTVDYPRHACERHTEEVHDSIGTGRRFAIVHSAPDRPEFWQHITLYEGKPFFLMRAEVRSPQTLSASRIGAIVMDSQGSVEIGADGDRRILQVPFDNDMWFRYNAMEIDSEGVSSEVTALYRNETRNGLVFGSVNHEKWKTGIRFAGSGGRLREFEVFAGLATAGVNSFTHDTLPHGKVSGRSVSSPEIYVGFHDDWRDGLESYGRANANFRPPLAWDGPMPFGWNSWAAYTSHIDYSRYLGAADFISRELAPKGFERDGVVYINFDSSWSRLDAAALENVVAWLKARGRESGIDLRAGIYFTPFAQWGEDLDRFVEGAGVQYRYRDILLRCPDGSLPPKLAGGNALDPTHPGTQARIRTYISALRKLGFRYIKLDFLSHGALEGVHYDKSVETGIEAYSRGMQCALDAAGGEMLSVSQSLRCFPRATATPAAFRATPWATSAARTSPPNTC